MNEICPFLNRKCLGERCVMWLKEPLRYPTKDNKQFQEGYSIILANNLTIITGQQMLYCKCNNEKSREMFKQITKNSMPPGCYKEKL